MKLAIPDLISPSYFPAIAAIELGLCRKQGLTVELEVISPVDAAYRALRDGTVDFVGGSSHSAASAFPDWDGVKLICAQSRGLYWFLVMRSDLGLTRGDLAGLKGCRIGAAPWVRLTLERLLAISGIDTTPGIGRDGVEIVPIPGATGTRVNYGVTAAQALAEGTLDGFWANGMGAELAVRRGIGMVMLDPRRGDGPPEGFDCTMATIATTDRLIAKAPTAAIGMARAVAEAQAMLTRQPDLATEVASHLFPPEEMALIADLIRRDAPFYDPALPESAIAGMLNFSRAMGIVSKPLAYDDVVATGVRAALT
ncbi:nitrate ABC transporter substrate-binding protein [Skermanella stibiiresistens SB22]|uniref:Nitrate ABC transporter substrate-binding protein n=1 Tax=Skermanella stibiiresistens SB22 TaxID=1385369 RepID=W9GXM3_9PROT|nr:ABC transporter substrate-binding protein [Skermanella stibiiresistens]EWY37192.1 nitrate ABC transporter substrate-binding protein [Skermanella stibiiresistens SB22]